jgi:hypothetical protein
VQTGGVPAAPAVRDTTDRRIRDDRPKPSASKVAGLRELENEVAAFARLGGSYRDTVTSLIKREYRRQRAEREQTFSSQISL